LFCFSFISDVTTALVADHYRKLKPIHGS